ncbi:hypothetical protein [Streptomyces sp. NPDC101150]|uniref:hypothetical protein n=1 Tax=Streptomyces sp. NPDC101150 TaxID=3366114 RepID=UPI0038157FB2
MSKRVTAARTTSDTSDADLTAGDLVQLVTGSALSTVRDEGTDHAHRLLTLVLDAAHGVPRRSK